MEYDFLNNFFTHKNFLPPASEIPGTLGTPLHIIFELTLLVFIISSALLLSKHKDKIKVVFKMIWISCVVLEIGIISWDSIASKEGIDFQYGLSLYPCSLFLYTLPFAIWGKGKWKNIACGYICTLGLLGALVNFIFPAHRLADYSCISFPALHTFFFHGSMLFVCLVMLISKYHTYHAEHRLDLFYPCVASLILSIPANILNYSPINSDYMYFKGYYPLLETIFTNWEPIHITMVLYALYIIVPAMFYMPSYIKNTHYDLVNNHFTLRKIN